jgi:hypothetical protein
METMTNLNDAATMLLAAGALSALLSILTSKTWTTPQKFLVALVTSVALGALLAWWEGADTREEYNTYVIQFIVATQGVHGLLRVSGSADALEDKIMPGGITDPTASVE